MPSKKQLAIRAKKQQQKAEEYFNQMDKFPLPSEILDTYVAKVVRMLGGLHVEVQIPSGKVFIARIPGSMKRSRRKGCWITTESIVLVNGTSPPVDIVYVYKEDEARKLVKQGYLEDDEKSLFPEETEDDDDEVEIDFIDI